MNLESLLEQIKKNPNNIKDIENPTEDLCIYAIRIDYRVLRFINNQSINVCTKAIKINYKSLKYVKDQTIPIIIHAIRINPKAFKYIDDQNDKIYEICAGINYKIIDYAKFPRNIERYIPDHLKYKYLSDKEIYMDMKRTHSYSFIKFIDDPSFNLCKMVIDINICNLNFIQNPTIELCSYAIKKDYCSLRYIKNQTLELCILAININRKAIEYVDKKLFSQIYEYYDFDNTWPEIRFLRNKDFPINFDYCISNTWIFQYLTFSKYDIHWGMLVNLVKKGRYDKYFLNLNNELDILIIKLDPYLLKYVNNKTKELCLEAIKLCASLIASIDNPDRDLCIEAIKKDPFSLQYIKKQDLEMCKLAVSLNPLSFRYAQVQDKEMCINAAKHSITLVPYANKISKELYKSIFQFDGKEKIHCYFGYLKIKYMLDINFQFECIRSYIYFETFAFLRENIYLPTKKAIDKYLIQEKKFSKKELEKHINNFFKYFAEGTYYVEGSGSNFYDCDKLINMFIEKKELN